MDNTFLSKPQLYGGFGGFQKAPLNEAIFVRRQRQRMNLMGACWCLFFPWISFCLVYAATSFNWRYSEPWLSWLIVGIFSVVTLFFGVLAVGSMRSKMKDNESHEPNWFTFLFITMAIAVGVGAVLGNLNFFSFMQRYYDYVNLNDYKFVNVARMRGEQLMDGARAEFIPGTTVDLRKAMGFKNLNTYCVAPLTVTNDDKVREELSNYDFWAVGMDCCSGDMTDFHCGEYNNPKARGGLRLMQDNERSFYRLAVQQAESMYHVKANHPLFFYWTEDPVKEMESWREEGYKFFFLGMLVHFCWQLLCVVLGIVSFSKIGLY